MAQCGRVARRWMTFRRLLGVVRRDGTKLRSGTFDNGDQSGEWTTYDKQGNVYKVTRIKPRAP
jgi:antitoxin component YwqK of YwqJK toxin-antitoxin module